MSGFRNGVFAPAGLGHQALYSTQSISTTSSDSPAVQMPFAKYPLGVKGMSKTYG